MNVCIFRNMDGNVLAVRQEDGAVYAYKEIFADTTAACDAWNAFAILITSYDDLSPYMEACIILRYFVRLPDDLAALLDFASSAPFPECILSGAAGH